jgi:hypothetical protein
VGKVRAALGELVDEIFVASSLEDSQIVMDGVVLDEGHPDGGYLSDLELAPGVTHIVVSLVGVAPLPRPGIVLISPETTGL